MNQKNPLISVIIPAFNAEAFIGEAIESILQQNYSPLEVIVVDDGSTDATARVVKSFGKKVKYIFQENRGAPTARNHGLSLAKGEIIGFLDADDLWVQNKLDIQLSHLNKNKSLDVVVGRKRQYKLVKKKNEKIHFILDDESEKALNLGAALFKKFVFDKAGVFDTKLLCTDDWDWFIRAKDLGISIGMFSEVTLHHRLHESNITRDQKTGNHYLLKMLKKNIDRRHHKQQSDIKSFHMNTASEPTKKET